MLTRSSNGLGYTTEGSSVERGLKDVNDPSRTMPPDMMKEVQDNMTNAQFMIRFSTWPPNLEFSNLHERAMRTLHSIFCRWEIQEGAGDSVCVLRNETVNNGSLEQVETEMEAPLGKDMEAAEDTLLSMAVEDFDESHNSNSSLSTETLYWTDWSILFRVTRLGSFIIHTVVVNNMVNTMETPLTAQNIYAAGVEFLEDQLSEQLKKNILSGNFDRLMNERSSLGARVATSIPGMEEQTFYKLQHPLVASPSSHTGPDDAENQQMIYIALFFAGLGVGFFVILGVLIVACRTTKNDDQTLYDKNGQTDRDESQSNHDAMYRGRIEEDTIVVVQTSQMLDDRIRRGLRRSKSNDSRSSLGGDSSGHLYAGTGSVVSELSFAGSAAGAGSVAEAAAVAAGSTAASAVSSLSDAVVSKLDYENRSVISQEDSWA
jgi:hypothetical protein